MNGPARLNKEIIVKATFLGEKKATFSLTSTGCNFLSRTSFVIRFFSGLIARRDLFISEVYVVFRATWGTLKSFSSIFLSVDIYYLLSKDFKYKT